MSLESLLAAIGVDLAAFDFLLTQIGVLTGTGLLFLLSLVACMMAFRAAGSARRSRLDAEAHFRSAQTLATEIRHLTAQMETATRTAGPRDYDKPTDYASVEIGAADNAGAELEAAEAALEAAKRAATEPSDLLRERRWR